MTVAVGACLWLGPGAASAGDLYGDILAAPSDFHASGASAALQIDALRPLPNQPIELCGKAGGGCESQFTDGAGYYQFDDLESGTYTLKTPGSDGRLLEKDVTVDQGNAQQLRILTR